MYKNTYINMCSGYLFMYIKKKKIRVINKVKENKATERLTTFQYLYLIRTFNTNNNIPVHNNNNIIKHHQK